MGKQMLRIVDDSAKTKAYCLEANYIESSNCRGKQTEPKNSCLITNHVEKELLQTPWEN